MSKSNGSKSKSAPVVNIGSSSLLVIFLILCLVVFAILTLSSASSDYRFSQRIADRNTDYYTAVAKAEQTWDELDRQVSTTGGASAEPSVSYQVPINDSQELQVELALAGDATEGYHYNIVKWQTVNTKKWTGDDTMNLMDLD